MSNRPLQLRLWLLGMNIYEQKLRVRMARTMARFIKEAASQYESGGSIPAYLADSHRRNIRRALEDHYNEVIPYFGKLVLRNVKSRRIEKKAAESLFSRLMAEWVTTQALAKATRIASTDADNIRDAIQSGIDAGDGVASIASNIRKVSQQTPYRAALIARTETHSAATYGSVQTAREAENELGLQLKKVWLATLDNRTRESHRDADGQTVDLNERFLIDGVYMDRPGDDSAPPEETINCRCGIAHEEKE